MKTDPDQLKRQMQARLKALYEDAAEEVWEQMQRLLVPLSELKAVDGALWSEQDAFLITYGDSVKQAGEMPLCSLTRFVREHLGDAVSLVHILPFFPYTSDDGFSISDYRAVREDLGGWDDVSELNQSHDLMFDLVLNHCSASHEWFRQFLAGEKPGRDYFTVPAPGADVKDVVRPRTHPLLTPFQTPTGERKVWTTFSEDQVDLDFSNPDVLIEFLEVLLLYVRQGARMIRLDAVAFLWKEPGTPCIHLWQTHEVVKLMRDLLDVVAPGVVLLTETNVPHQENVSYFGHGDEARMVYQFSLPPLLLLGLRRGEAASLTEWGMQLEPPPTGCTFFNFTASHDGVGVRPLEGLVPSEEVTALADEIRQAGGRVSERSHADGSTTPYELNATYFSALRLPDDDDVSHFRRFLLSQTVPMCLQGIPAFYVHSFTATPNDLEGLSRTGRNRTINRKQWDLGELCSLLDDETTSSSRAMREITTRLRLRGGIPDFHPDVPQEVLSLDARVFAVRRGKVTALHNFSHEAVSIAVSGSDLLLHDEQVSLENGLCRLPPLSVAWISD